MSIKLHNKIKSIFLVKSIMLAFFALFVFGLSSDVASAQVCNLINPTECASGLDCVNDPSNPGQGICQNGTSGSTGPVRDVSFGPPTSATGFADVICNITDFLSTTIVPPIAVLMILVVGFLYLISQGEPEKLKLANRMLVFTVIGVAVVLLSPAIVALFADITGQTVSISACSGVGATTDTIVNSILNLVDWMAWFIAVTAVIMVLYSAFLFLTASDNSEKIQKAYKIFIFAIIGIAIAMLSFGIVSITELFL